MKLSKRTQAWCEATDCSGFDRSHISFSFAGTAVFWLLTSSGIREYDAMHNACANIDEMREKGTWFNLEEANK